VLFGADLHTFLQLVEWTISFALLSTLFSFMIGLGLALLLNDTRIRERSLYRTLLIVPWALPGTISILAWTGIFNDDFGYLNEVLGHLGLGSVPWFGSPLWAKVAVLVVNTWLAYPFMMAACLGALQSVPFELDEAATVDGAGPVSRFRFVTLPFLRPVITPLLIGVFAYQFNNFNVIYLLTSGNRATSDPTANRLPAHWQSAHASHQHDGQGSRRCLREAVCSARTSSSTRSTSKEASPCSGSTHGTPRTARSSPPSRRCRRSRRERMQAPRRPCTSSCSRRFNPALRSSAARSRRGT
jgi:ABC-type spermidine/putrescine transport system permease subunit II